jgi:hypothetical protein
MNHLSGNSPEPPPARVYVNLLVFMTKWGTWEFEDDMWMKLEPITMGVWVHHQ